MSKYNPMSEETWRTQVKEKAVPYSVFFVEGSSLADIAVQFGTGDDNSDETVVKANPNHVGNYLGDGMNKTFEADGKRLAYHFLDDYKDKVMKGELRMIFFTAPALTQAECECIRRAIKEYEGKNYNGWELFWFGVGGLLRKTPLGFIADWFKNPAYKSDSVVCSQLSILIFKYVARIYEPIIKGIDISKVTPEVLFDRMLRVFKYQFDTADLEG